jgi:hypothetical protein
VNPLDRFIVESSVDGGQRLCFSDLAVETGLDRPERTRYRYELSVNGVPVEHSEEFLETCITLPDVDARRSFLEAAGADGAVTPQWEYAIRTYRDGTGRWSRAVRVYLEVDGDTKAFSLLGVRRGG